MDKNVKKKEVKSKKKNIKTNKIYIVYKILTILVLIGMISLIIVFFEKKKILEEINNNYSEKIIVKRNAKIYDKSNIVIGNVNKGYKFSLEPVKEKRTRQRYFNIKDTKLYLYYKDIKPYKDKEKDKEEKSNYIVFNKNIKTSKKTNFYDKDKIVMSINRSIELPIEYMDNNYYYVNYLGNSLSIKKSKSIKELEHNNTEEKETTNISVLHFDTINNECKEEKCISYDKFIEDINYIKEQGYYSISLDEYKQFLNKNIRLKEKAILITTSNDNDIIKKYNEDNSYSIEVINDKSGLKFNDTNKCSNKDSKVDNIDRYVIKSNTSNDEFHKMVAGEEIVKVVPIYNRTNEQSIAVINYHFFYDGAKGEFCGENICLDVSNFREQLNYLRDNGYKTLKMEEFTKWMYGEIELPEKSVLLTVDDGAFGTGRHNGNHLITILEEYNMNATLFLITGWWDVENYRSKNLDIQSHTFDMHQAGSCGRGQVVCATKEELMADLQKSLAIVDNNNSFCFPFYSYSDLAVETVREAGFKTAFIGGNRKAKRSDNKYLIPRYPIYKGTTLEQFKYMVG